MSWDDPKMQCLAKRLIVYELTERKAVKGESANNCTEYEKLCPHLAALMGNDGFRTLLSRAHTLASVKIPELRIVQVKEDGTLESLKKLNSESVASNFIETRMVLLAQLLELLVTFIGENLTLHLIAQVWPQVSLRKLDSVDVIRREKSVLENEKAK